MMNSSNNEGFDFPIKRFEEMMNSNQVLYFDASEFENIIQYYMDFGRMGLAKKAIKMGLQQHPNSFKLLLLKADLLSFEDKSKEAFSLLKYLLEIEPYNEDLYVMLASLYSKQDEHKKAIRCLEKILSLGGQTTVEDVHYLLGMEYLMLENYQTAKDHFIKTLEIDGDDEISLQNIVFCYEFLGKISDAKCFLNEYLNKNPYSAIGWHQLGNIYQNEEAFEQAINCYDYAIISDDYFVGAIIEKAKVLEKTEDYKKAIEFFQLALTMEEPTSFIHYRIGNCYLKLNQENKAVSSFKKSVFEDPQFSIAWYALAEIFFYSDPEKAYRFLSKAKKLEPQNLSYTRKFAILCTHLSLHEEAFDAWSEVDEIKGELADELIEEVEHLVMIGDLQMANDIMNDEMDLTLDHFNVYLRMVILEYLVGENHNLLQLETLNDSEDFSSEDAFYFYSLLTKHKKLIDETKLKNLEQIIHSWVKK